MEKLHKVKGEKMGMDMPAKNVRILPTLRLTDEDLPEIKDWEVGKTYKVVIEMEQISKRQGDEWQGSDNKDKKVHGTFKITEIGVEEQPEEDYPTEYARRMNGKR